MRAVNAGDGVMITVEFLIRRASGSGDFDMTTFFDIGGVIPPLYTRTLSLPGTGERAVTFSTAAYTLDTWVTNGADWFINTSVATEVWGKRLVVHRIHRGFGTYPPA